MDIITFLTERIAEDLVGLSDTVTPRRRREALVKYKILEIHSKWPVLVQGPMKFSSDLTLDPNKFAMSATQQIEWMTNKEYINRFGTQSPTAPIVLALAAVYCDHPDYDPAWVQ